MLVLHAALAYAEEPAPEAPAFSAGSYGRVQASTDLGGGGGDAVNVAVHAPRLELDPYMELDLGWRAEMDSGARFDVLVTPALSGMPFHYDGEFQADLALRNLYAEASDFVGAPVSVWAGSRMYRGDDVYLLDFWPLDNLNTFGGGAGWRPEGTEVAVHVGVNRLSGDDWQVQEILVATPDGVSGQPTLVLDRQRTIATLRASREVPVGEITLRAKVYGELHTLPEGQRYVDDPFADLELEYLPADRGSTVGLQLSAWGWAPQSFVHLWARRSTGLGAYGDLAIPVDGLTLDLRAAPAREWMLAAAGNTELGPVGVMAAAYGQYRVDADGLEIDVDDRWDVVGVIRPNVYVSEHVAIGAEASHQWVRPNGLNPRTGTFDKPSVTKLSVLPGVQAGRGGYTRPRIQLVYTATLLDDEARAWFDPLDARIGEGNVQHYVGLGAEWWLNTQRVILPE
jgi:maltoporin